MIAKTGSMGIYRYMVSTHEIPRESKSTATGLGGSAQGENIQLVKMVEIIRQN